MEKVDILAIAAHPDDVELGCCGTLMKAVAEGKKVGICDLTQGELGTRGSAEIRLKEAEAARKLIGAQFRVNLGMADGFFAVNRENQLKIIEVIRACRPDIVLCNALSDRHPDHARAAELEKTACFLSGLRKMETRHDDRPQEPWRPRLVLHYIQDNFLVPHVVVDISAFWEKKMEAIKTFASQFYDPNSKEPGSSISSKDFMDTTEGRAHNMGRYLFVRYGEGFQCERPLGVGQLWDVY